MHSTKGLLERHLPFMNSITGAKETSLFSRVLRSSVVLVDVVVVVAAGAGEVAAAEASSFTARDNSWGLAPSTVDLTCPPFLHPRAHAASRKLVRPPNQCLEEGKRGTPGGTRRRAQP